MLLKLISSLLQIVDVPSKLPERDFAGTPYIPVYVMLPVRLQYLCLVAISSICRLLYVLFILLFQSAAPAEWMHISVLIFNFMRTASS